MGKVSYENEVCAVGNYPTLNHSNILHFILFFFPQYPQSTPVFLPGESQGRGSLVGCCLWGRTESDTTEAT